MEKISVPIASQENLEEKASRAFEKYQRGKNSRGRAPVEVSNRTLADYLIDLGNIFEAKYCQDQILIQQNRELLNELRMYNEYKQSEEYLNGKKY